MKKLSKISLSEKTLMLTPYQLYNKYKTQMATAAGWADTTQNDYYKHMLMLDQHLKISFIDAEIDDFEKAIQHRAAQYSKEKRSEYSENSIDKYRTVIKNLCEFAENQSNGVYFDVTWGTFWQRIKPKSSNSNVNKNAKLAVENRLQELEEIFTLPRSLKTVEEQKLAKLLLEKYISSGEITGALIMFYLGLRPGECCGLTYGDIRKVDGVKDLFALYVYEQAKSDGAISSQLKSENAYRIMPLPTELHELLLTKMRVINLSNIDNLPIVCDGENHNDPCTRKRFAKICVQILRSIDVSERTVSKLAQNLRLDNSIKEKEPTLYLLRRHFATMLSSVCNMDDGELQYLMGHSIEQNDQRRSDYLNPDKLLAMRNKLDRRRIFSLPQSSDFEIKIESLKTVQNMPKAIITVSHDYIDLHNGAVIDVYANAAGDLLKLKLNKSSTSSPTLLVSSDLAPAQENILPLDMQSEYFNALETSRNRSSGKLK